MPLPLKLIVVAVAICFIPITKVMCGGSNKKRTINVVQQRKINGGKKEMVAL
jgi:hypothetical protein